MLRLQVLLLLLALAWPRRMEYYQLIESLGVEGSCDAAVGQLSLDRIPPALHRRPVSSKKS